LGEQREETRVKQLDLCYIRKSLLHPTSFALSEGEEHLFDHRMRSSLHRREIIRFVSSSCLKTFAFLHFLMFQRMQVRTVLLILEHLSIRGFTVQSCSIPIEFCSEFRLKPMKVQKLALRGHEMNRWKQTSSEVQKGTLPC
jgi:hypothetical protein